MDSVLIIKLLISSTLMSSLLVILIFFVKQVFRTSISAKLHYIIWFILLLRLVVPYIGHSP
jgi:beta-lactamase regulating signal transducer with metallopeptidase domain